MSSVPNPRYAELQQVLAEVRTRAERLEAALDPPYRQFTGRAVWVGETADGFGKALALHRSRLKAAARALVAAVEAELRDTPREVSPAAAKDL
jgi:hypothetical protein